MKVALVCPYSADVPGGVWTHVLGLGEWLAEQGHEPCIVAPGTGPVEAEIPIHLVGRAVGFRFNGSTARLALSRRQVAAATELVADADVVHVHEALTPGLAYGVAKRARRLVVTHHAHFSPPQALAAILRRRAAALPTRSTVAVSSASASTARQVTGERAQVIPNAISLPDVAPKPDTDPPIVLFVGRRDDPRKGFGIFEELARHVPEARFVAVGPGGSSVAPEIEAHGAVGRGALHAWLQRAAVLVAPNTGGESFGMVLVEALAHGCTLVCSQLQAFRDVVDDERVVSWFPPGDADSAARALRERLRAEPAPQTARAIAAQYAWEIVGPRIVGTYERAGLG